jgi:heme iron utilization protein
MNQAQEYREKLVRLLAGQQLAVLASEQPGEPYASLVAFASTCDLTGLVVATTRATRKYMNLTARPQVALLIDNRSNTAADFSDAMAVTAIGQARETTGAEQNTLAQLFIARHPYLEGFVRAPTTALFRIEVERYRLVERFQQVVDLDVRQWS